MSTLQELLAVESEMDAGFDGIVQETSAAFKLRLDRFEGHEKTLEMFGTERKAEGFTKHVEVANTVSGTLERMFEHVARVIDFNLQTEAAKQSAVADVVIEDEVTGAKTTIGTKLPSAFLLGLAVKLKEIRDVLNEIPTVPPGYTWTSQNSADKPGLLRRNALEFRTKLENVIKPLVLYPATDRHPAQVKELSEDVPVGKCTIVHYSGMLMPSDKRRLLGRVDAFIRAVKQARQRAHTVEAPPASIGESIQKFILG